MVADAVADKGYIGDEWRKPMRQKVWKYKACTCGGKGIRTPDPLHAMQVLYQLSYTPESGPQILPVPANRLLCAGP